MQIDYLSAIEEGKYVIAQANAGLDDAGKLVDELVSARENGESVLTTPERIQYMDVAADADRLGGGLAGALPEHDDANRALMGANMQRQPCRCCAREGLRRHRRRARGRGRLGHRRHRAPRRVSDYVDTNRIVIRVNDNETWP